MEEYDSEIENILSNDLEDGCFENSYAVTNVWRLLDDETVHINDKPSLTFNIPTIVFPIKPKVFTSNTSILKKKEEKVETEEKEKSEEEIELIDKIVNTVDKWNQKERLRLDLPCTPSDMKTYTDSGGILVLSHIDAEMHVFRKSKIDLVNQSKNSASIPKCQLFYPLIKKQQDGTFAFKVMNIV